MTSLEELAGSMTLDDILDKYGSMARWEHGEEEPARRVAKAELRELMLNLVDEAIKEDGDD